LVINGTEYDCAYLDLSGRHPEFFREILATRSVWLLVGDKDALQDVELSGGGSLASLDGVRHVRVEHLRVYFGRVNARWNERRDVRTVGMLWYCSGVGSRRWSVGGGRCRVGRIPQLHGL